MADVFVGLDCEMTGTDIDVYDVCQVGVYLSSGELFVSDVRPSNPQVFDPDSLAVNGFTPERLQAAPQAREVDERLLRWLNERLGNATAHPIGWGVSLLRHAVRPKVPPGNVAASFAALG